jgi:hypothetical protein
VGYVLMLVGWGMQLFVIFTLANTNSSLDKIARILSRIAPPEEEQPEFPRPGLASEPLEQAE